MVIVHVFISQVDFLLTESAFTTLVKPQGYPLGTTDDFTHPSYSQFLSVGNPVRVEGVEIPLYVDVPDNFHVRQFTQRQRHHYIASVRVLLQSRVLCACT